MFVEKTQAKIDFLSRAVSLTVVLGFFLCVSHIVPANIAHAEDDTNNNHDVACVDHQIFSTPSHDKHISVVLTNFDVGIAIVAYDSIVQPVELALARIYSLDDPPEKIPLFIQHKVLRV